MNLLVSPDFSKFVKAGPLLRANFEKRALAPRHFVSAIVIAGRVGMGENSFQGRDQWTRIDRCRRLSHSLAPLGGWPWFAGLTGLPSGSAGNWRKPASPGPSKPPDRTKFRRYGVTPTPAPTGRDNRPLP